MKRLLAGIALLLLVSGCCSIEYNGKEIAQIVRKDQVELYFSQEQFPKNADQEVLGDAVASAGTNWTARELQAKLKDFAAEKGANGILIDKIEKIPAGKARADQIKNLPSKTWQVDDNSSNAAAYFRDDMTNYSKKEADEQEVYRLVIRAKLIRFTEK